MGSMQVELKITSLCRSHTSLALWKQVHHMNEKVSTKGRLSMGPVENQWSTPTCVCRILTAEGEDIELQGTNMTRCRR